MSQSLFHYYDKTPWTRQLTKESIRLGLQSHRVRAMIAEQRHGGRNSRQAHTFMWTRGIEAHRGWNHSLETSKPIPGDISPPGRSHLSILPKQLYPLGLKGSNTLTYKSHSYSNHYSYWKLTLFLFSENIKLTFTFQLLHIPVSVSISFKNYSIAAGEMAQKFKTPTAFAKDKNC